ncbi:MAG: sigma-54-dependent Fis family transcriptional regulator [Acidobacteria bacterium]|nr:sigma-54-dependent Fis family transcriptional regulator [Acidobacteriota bacterium]
MAARKRKLLVVDDDPGIRTSLLVLLQNWGFEVLQACDAAEATAIVERHDPEIVITDVVMPEVSGLELLRTLKAGDPHRPVLLITAQGSIDMAVEAMKQGARDFLTKPLTDLPKLKALLDDAEREIELRRRVKRLSMRAETEAGLGDFVGCSKAMRGVFELIESIAGRDVSVMLTGESGTGKEMAARGIHQSSRRQSKPFVAINAAAVPESLMESELFGHERGAFTGAVGTRQGCFEQANGGTLFIDEIAEMPLALQPKLLRVLGDGRVRRLGGSQEFEFDVRIIAATNQDPSKAIEEGRLRDDLYYRLSVFPIVLPPLRDRPEDIPLLVHRFVGEFNRKHGLNIEGATDESLALLRDYPWPGNVRELRNVIERSVVLTKTDWIDENNLPPYVRNPALRPAKLVFAVGATTVADAERELILKTLEYAGNNKAEAARRLGVDVKTIYNKLKSYGIDT